MSVRQMSMVWDLDLDPNHKIVLLAYADHADDDGDNVYPSLGRMAHKTGYSPDQIRRISRQLASDGLMELVEKGAGRGNTHRYKLTLGKGSKLPAFKPKRKKVASDEEKVASEPLKGGTATPPEPSQRTVIEEPSRSEEVTNVPSSAPDEPPRPGTDDEWPGDDAPMGKRQAYFVGYLHRRLEERELLDNKPMTPSYRKQLVGEVATHLNKGFRRGRILHGLDYIMFRWPKERVGLSVGIDRAEGQDNVTQLRSVGNEAHRRKKRVI